MLDITPIGHEPDTICTCGNSRESFTLSEDRETYLAKSICETARRRRVSRRYEICGRTMHYSRLYDRRSSGKENDVTLRPAGRTVLRRTLALTTAPCNKMWSYGTFISEALSALRF